MRKYTIHNADGVKVSEVELEDSFAPPLLAGHIARIVEINGERIAKSAQVEIGPDAGDAVPEHLETEAEASARREAERAEREARKAEREAAKEADRIANEPAEPPTPSFEPVPEPAPDTTA